MITVKSKKKGEMDPPYYLIKLPHPQLPLEASRDVAASFRIFGSRFYTLLGTKDIGDKLTKERNERRSGKGNHLKRD